MDIRQAALEGASPSRHSGSPAPHRGSDLALATMVGGSPRRALRSAAAQAAARSEVASPPGPRLGGDAGSPASRRAAVAAAAAAASSAFAFRGTPALSSSPLHGRLLPRCASSIALRDGATVEGVVATLRHALRLEAQAALAAPGSAAAAVAVPGLMRYAHRVIVVDARRASASAGWGRLVLVSLGDTARSADAAALLDAVESRPSDGPIGPLSRSAALGALKTAHSWATVETTAVGRVLSGKVPPLVPGQSPLPKGAEASHLAAAAASPLLRLVAPAMDPERGAVAFAVVAPDRPTDGRRLRLLQAGGTVRGAARCPDDGASTDAIAETIRFAARLRRNVSKLRSGAARSGCSAGYRGGSEAAASSVGLAARLTPAQQRGAASLPEPAAQTQSSVATAATQEPRVLDPAASAAASLALSAVASPPQHPAQTAAASQGPVSARAAPATSRAQGVPAAADKFGPDSSAFSTPPGAQPGRERSGSSARPPSTAVGSGSGTTSRRENREDGTGTAAAAVWAASGSSAGRRDAAAIDAVVEPLAEAAARGVVPLGGSAHALGHAAGSRVRFGSVAGRLGGSFHSDAGTRPPRGSTAEMPRVTSAELQRRLSRLPHTQHGIAVIPDDTGSGTSNGPDDDLADSDEDSDAAESPDSADVDHWGAR
ncbi:hypothetical protein FNF29_04029 [Cafeteria roenbergensis]|uniref:Uncharacterized protein n=1 Tax=Cafeteria roenbergensis TaxID=33653 RepID=A0A5A8CGH1_CAFRO|nr:hypothetical protein FNF29_04029 [Cafeteria roenbergensis]|eukprot:KAA0152162.1 hypothetical protein FNF29_04029 [Cafeteria roenbergensis]